MRACGVLRGLNRVCAVSARSAVRDGRKDGKEWVVNVGEVTVRKV